MTRIVLCLRRVRMNSRCSCSRRLISPVLRAITTSSFLPRPSSLTSTIVRPQPSIPRVHLFSSLLPKRMDASVNEDFVHVADPVIFSVYDDESTNPPDPAADVQYQDEQGREGDGEEDGEGGEEQEWRKVVLPEELSKSVVHLQCDTAADGGVCDVYLVGTAHVSKESCREVQDVVDYLKPQVVFLELCASRIAILNPPQSYQDTMEKGIPTSCMVFLELCASRIAFLNPPQSYQVPTFREMIDAWKKKDSNALGIVYGWFLAKVASQLDILPGAEFRVAFEVARSYGAKVILGDRPVHITLRRTWGNMPLWHKVKFIYSMLFQAVFLPSADDLQKMLKEIDDADMVTLLVQEMSKEFPTIMETLVYERDMYMSSKLLQVASNHSSVVAVVGKGHLSGIKKYWNKDIELEHILEIPPNSGLSTMKILASLSVAVTGAVIVSGIYIFGKR